MAGRALEGRSLMIRRRHPRLHTRENQQRASFFLSLNGLLSPCERRKGIHEREPSFFSTHVTFSMNQCSPWANGQVVICRAESNHAAGMGEWQLHDLMARVPFGGNALALAGRWGWCSRRKARAGALAW